MSQTTQAIYDELSQNGGRYHIEFINTSDGNDTAIRIFDPVTVSPDKQVKLLGHSIRSTANTAMLNSPSTRKTASTSSTTIPFPAATRKKVHWRW